MGQGILLKTTVGQESVSRVPELHVGVVYHESSRKILNPTLPIQILYNCGN